jgi:hypothetical protein
MHELANARAILKLEVGSAATNRWMESIERWFGNAVQLGVEGQI